ncbi:hypothetical protein, partial [Corynebacterium amycolatum]|uniref:hypothetical protein n=1 Tax=Corynebacterium amycolatum TaxID=43765 RepID=UPI00255190A2
LSRPSSAYYAKASTMRPYNTTHKQITKNNHKQKNCLTKSNLQKNKMLASTIQFSHNTHTPQNKPPQQQPARSTQQPVNRNNNMCHPRHPTAHQQPTNTKGKHKRLKSSHARADHHFSDLTSRCSTQKTKNSHTPPTR